MDQKSSRPKPHFLTALASQPFLVVALWTPPALFIYWIDISELAQILLIPVWFLYLAIFSLVVITFLAWLADLLDLDHSLGWQERYDWSGEEFGMYYMSSGLIGSSPFIYFAIWDSIGLKLFFGLVFAFLSGAFFLAPPFGKFGLAFSDILHKCFSNLYLRLVRRS